MNEIFAWFCVWFPGTCQSKLNDALICCGGHLPCCYTIVPPIALLHQVTFGKELLDALEFGGPSLQYPCPTVLTAWIKDRIGYLLGIRFCFLAAGRAQSFLLLGSERHEKSLCGAYRPAGGEMTVRRACLPGERPGAPPLAPASAQNMRTYKESLGQREEDEVIHTYSWRWKGTENIPRISLSLWGKDSTARH